MSIIATAVRHLMAAGITGEALVQAIADMEAAQTKTDAVAEKRRAYDRERKRKAKDNSTGIPPESADSTESAETVALSLPPNENISNPPTHTHPDITRVREATQFSCPDGVDPIDWRGLLANRQKQRAPMTESAYRQICKKLDGWARQGWPPGPVVAAAAERGWRTVFETDEMKGAKNGKNIRTGSNGSSDNRSTLARVIDDGLEWLDRPQAGIHGNVQALGSPVQAQRQRQ